MTPDEAQELQDRITRLVNAALDLPPPEDALAPVRAGQVFNSTASLLDKWIRANIQAEHDAQVDAAETNMKLEDLRSQLRVFMEAGRSGKIASLGMVAKASRVLAHSESEWGLNSGPKRSDEKAPTSRRIRVRSTKAGGKL